MLDLLRGLAGAGPRFFSPGASRRRARSRGRGVRSSRSGAISAPEGAFPQQSRTKGPLRRQKLAGRRVVAAITSEVSPPASESRRRARFRGRRGMRRLLRLPHRAFRPQPEPPPIHVRARTRDPRRSIQVRGANAYRPGSSRWGPLAGGRVPAAAAYGVPAPAPFRRRSMRSRSNRVQKGPSGEKSSPGGALSQQSRPREALRRQNLAGGLILAGGHVVVAASSSQRRRRNATAPLVTYGRGLPQLLQKRPVFCVPHEQVHGPSAG
jgi:hypothetical protein